MAPLPENNTARGWLDYTSSGRVHSLLVRYNSTAPTNQVLASLQGIAAVLRTRMLQTDSIFGARYSQQFSNFSTPLPWTTSQGTISGANTTWENDPESAMLSLPGRDGVVGRDVLYCLFTPVRTTTWPNDNRYQAGDEPVIDTFRINLTNALLEEEGIVAGAVTISGYPPIVKGYVNISHNAYWQRKQRRGG